MNLWYNPFIKQFKEFPIIIINQTLKEQFQKFCALNKPKDLETAINYFAVFGGLDLKIDMTKPLGILIKRHILDPYYDLHDEIDKLIKADNVGYKILSGIALGDRRINSSFKRADVDYDEGIELIQTFCEKEIIREETSLDHLTNQFEENDSADKLVFASPFIRFWFAFVAPLYRGVKRGEYDECYERFDNRKQEFMDFIFEQLCHEYIKETFIEDEIEEIGRYWDSEDEIDLLAQTYSGRIIVGSCRYVDSKTKKNEINRLKDICKKLDIVPDFVVLFSKKGFTNEVKALKNESLKLYTAKSLKALLND